MTRRFLLALPFVGWFIKELPAAPQPPPDSLKDWTKKYFDKRAAEALSAKLRMHCLLRSEGQISLPTGRTIQFYR